MIAPRSRIVGEFGSFAAVGVVGFIVDAVIFLVLTSAAGLAPGWARMASATSAITVTWALNRNYTFAQRRSVDARKEYVRYLMAQAAGFTLNLGVFALALISSAFVRSQPFVALILGAGTALAFNYITARSFAFRRTEPRQ